MTTGRAIKQLVTERFEGGGTPKVDRTANVVRGMKIASWKSANGRDYTKALKGQAKLYEGAPVSIDHPAKDNVPATLSRFGVYKDVVEKDDGIYGDLHFNPKHTGAEQLLWAFENQPQTMANSHRVEAKAVKAKGILDVQQITKVRGVEIVTEGGMNSTLFEDYAPAADMPSPSDMAPPSDPAMTACIARVMGTGKNRSEAEAICSATPDNAPTSPDTAAATESLDEQESTMNLASMSLAEIKAARPDLAAELLKEARENDASEAELKTLREANQAFKLAEEKRTHEASLATKKTALREQCVKAKVPDGLISDLFIESLMSLDETKTAELIEDRKARATGPMPKSKAGDPAARIASGAPALTTSKLTESLNGR